MPVINPKPAVLNQKSSSKGNFNDKSPAANAMQANSAQPASTLTQQEADIFQALCECMAGMGQYRQFIFYVGTSCDSQKLRIQISLLQEKIFENIVYQKETITEFLKKTLSNKDTTDNSDRIERLICYTLTTLNCLETLVNQFGYLSESYPLDIVLKKELIVDLGSDETQFGNQLVLDNQKFFDTHLKQSHAAIDLKAAQTQSVDTTKSVGFHAQFDEKTELKIRLNIIKRLREEIEQIDTNLVRYNVKSESDDFVKLILDFSPDKETMIFNKVDLSPNKAAPKKDKPKPTSPPAATTPAKTPAAADAAPARAAANGSSVANVPKTTTLGSNWNKRKLIIFLGIIVVSILVIVALVCGLVFGLRK